MSKKKDNNLTDGELRMHGIHLTFTSHDGRIVKEFITDESFIIVNDDSDNLLVKEGKRLVLSHADQVFNSIGKWRQENG
jgi:hypothetical protein